MSVPPPAPADKARGGAGWKFELLGKLPDAGRVVTAADFHAFVEKHRGSSSVTTARAYADMLEAAGALQRVNQGLYLNRKARPPTELAEAAPYIRQGAAISLQSVLGEIGFMNNPTVMVTAVVPISSQLRPNLGQVVLPDQRRIAFFGLPVKFFPDPASPFDAELLQPGRHVATFRPEAALVQWLHLAHSSRSGMTLPPIQIAIEMLDFDRLEHLAKRYQVASVLRNWLEDAKAQNYGDEPDGEGERLY